MTKVEFKAIADRIVSVYPGTKLAQKEMMRVWYTELEHFDYEVGLMALDEMFATRFGDRSPSARDYKSTCNEIHLRIKRDKHSKERDEARAALLTKDEKIDVWPQDETEAWVKLHLHWTNVGINRSIARGLRDKSKGFPWDELIHSYRELSVRFPNLKANCESEILKTVAAKEGRKVSDNFIPNMTRGEV